jgi:hypothetical protein
VPASMPRWFTETSENQTGTANQNSGWINQKWHGYIECKRATSEKALSNLLESGLKEK